MPKTVASVASVRHSPTKTSRRPRAKTAYELLERVIAHIREEPRRYCQSTWGALAEWGLHPAGQRPPCGTIACRAGWIVALHDGMPSFRRRLRRHDYSVRDRANIILGFPPDTNTTVPLFHAEAVPPALRAQDVPAHARQGIQGLRAFMKQHKAHLQAQKLRGV